MGFLGIFSSHDINKGVERFRSTPGANLVDVRNPQEYAQGHIPGSINIPLPALDKAPSIIENKEAEVFVYCLSGGRSRQASAMLRHMGYEKVEDLGGISNYRGRVEK